MIVLSFKIHSALLALLLIGAAAACSQTPAPSPSIEGDVPIFVLEEWESLQEVEDPDGPFEGLRMTTSAADFRFRHVGENSGDLLLRHDPEPILGFNKANGTWVRTGRFQEFPLFRYDVEKQTLLRASEEEWIMAAGRIALCRTRIGRELQLDGRSNELRFKGQPVPTAGRLAVHYDQCHSGKLAAVVSADGPRERGDLVFGGDGAEGQHYHQIFSLKEGRYVGNIVRLPLVSAVGLNGCWSPDDRLVLYVELKKLAVVPVDESLGE